MKKVYSHPDAMPLSEYLDSDVDFDLYCAIHILDPFAQASEILRETWIDLIVSGARSSLHGVKITIRS